MVVKIPMTYAHLNFILLCLLVCRSCFKKCNYYSFKVLWFSWRFCIFSFFFSLLWELNICSNTHFVLFVHSMNFLCFAANGCFKILIYYILMQFDNFKTMQAQWCFETVSLVLESFLATLLLERNKNRKTDYYQKLVFMCIIL